MRGFSLAKSELGGKIRVAHPAQEWTPRVHHVTCHVTPGTCPLFYEQKGTTPQRQARLTGSTGLYMNDSIIFTEISFYPETSILLQIIRNNSYDISDYTRI